MFFLLYLSLYFEHLGCHLGINKMNTPIERVSYLGRLYLWLKLRIAVGETHLNQ